MSDLEESTLDTGYSTPVPELDDHRHQSVSIQRPRSRRGTADTTHSNMYSPLSPHSPRLGLVNDGLLQPQPMVRDFEEAIIDEESQRPSPQPEQEMANRPRRGTASTFDTRASSPPNSIKAFADARRREREMSTSYPEGGEHDLRRTISGVSKTSCRSRRLTQEDDAKSLAPSCKAAEADVCFPPHNRSTNKKTLDIDFEYLDLFIAEDQRDTSSRTPPKDQPHPRVFHDLRSGSHENATYTTDGDIISSGSSTVDEKSGQKIEINQLSLMAPNRFEFFSSSIEDTVHAARFGDICMPGENVRDLFKLSHGHPEADGVWWLNMNNPTEEEIRAICKAFGVHPLTIEDIHTQEAREKIELFPAYYFACFRSFHVVDDEGKGQIFEPFNIYVIVFREGVLSMSFSPNPHADFVRGRIAKLNDFIDLSSDWICYALIDHIVDKSGPIITKIEQETANIEDEVFVARTDDMQAFLHKIGSSRKNVMGLMKVLGGKADVLRGFTKRCNASFSVTPHMDIGLYLGDIQDHVVTQMSSLTHHEKMLSRTHANYLAQLSMSNVTQGNQANAVLAKITVLASILVPLNLVCGAFGMNVEVPWKDTEGLGPFFGILGFLVLFVVFALTLAKRFKYI